MPNKITGDDFCHRCTDKVCPSFGQRTNKNSCLCHMSREDMMLAEIERQRELIVTLESERDALKAQIADLREDLKWASYDADEI